MIRICQLVGGMPLGIELAAAWTGMLMPNEIAKEIARSLDILEADMQDAPERHGSIRAVLRPTWAQLDPVERDAFMKLSVFPGSFTREAAVEVAGATLPTLTTLVNKSLVRTSADGRYSLHELVRQYAAEQLGAEGGTVSTQQRHAEYYTALIERLGPPSWEAQAHFEQALVELGNEYNNVRAAVEWSLAHNKVAGVFRLLGAGHLFFRGRSHYIDGLRWAERILLQRHLAAPQDLIKVLVMASDAAYHRGKYSQAHRHATEALELARVRGDQVMTGWALNALAHAVFSQGDLDLAQSLYEEAIELFQEAGYKHQVTILLNILGHVAKSRGDLTQAAQYFEESRVKSMALGFKLPMLSADLGALLLEMGETTRARELFAQGLEYALRTGNPHYVASLIRLISDLAQRTGHRETAVRLRSASLVALDRLGVYDRELQTSKKGTSPRSELDQPTFDALWAKGHAMTLNEAVTLAQETLGRLEDMDLAADRPSKNQIGLEALTERELEVLALIAAGMTNRQIAAELTIAPGTVKTHVHNICDKLHAQNRTQAVAIARETGLLR